ncbi:MAG: thioesterase family protein, partial [Thermoleophilia bacterium]|nr:thioesterase family protein [Thermoleophilia bacterium]
GFTPPSPGSEAHGIILAANSCRYKAPVTYPDTLAIGARTSALSEDRFRMHYTAVSRKLHRVVAEGEALVVSYDYAARHRIPLPEAVREAIIALEGRELPPVSH